MKSTKKRMYRELNEETKQKISQALRGRRKSAAHIQAISKAMKKYWESIPKKTEDEIKEEGL
ncbi:hypothetical protein [Mediterranea massiliensis]|uniref:hypothetical protein n=1 Tax=Mediterranea massiliensis TaxID=1841865 RepID=UPI000932B727|nr:hypothetical protein [Mediterranea massiliensis]